MWAFFISSHPLLLHLECTSKKHINRAKTRILTAAVNHEEGYNSVVICTAKEVLDDEQEDV